MNYFSSSFRHYLVIIYVYLVKLKKFFGSVKRDDVINKGVTLST